MVILPQGMNKITVLITLSCAAIQYNARFSTVRFNLHHCNPYKVLVRSADVAAAEGCSCDSFSMTLRTFKHRKRICTYLSHIQKDYIINMDYVRLSTNLYIHHVRLSRNLYIHYVRLRPTFLQRS